MSALSARREAALRLPPLADGRRDPDLELPSCFICGQRDQEQLFTLRSTGRHMCKDRVECYRRYRPSLW